MAKCDLCFRPLVLDQSCAYHFKCSITNTGGCGHKALICKSCHSSRWSSLCHKKECRTCCKKGETFKSSVNSVIDLIDMTKRWDEALRHFSNIKLPKVKHILSCVGNFKRFNMNIHFFRIDYAMWIRRFFPLDRYNLESIHERFFQNVIQSYVPTVRRHFFSYDLFAMTTGLTLLTKNTTMAKLLICRLFRVRNRSISFLNAGMDSNKSDDQLMSMVFHRLISNLYYLIQL